MLLLESPTTVMNLSGPFGYDALNLSDRNYTLTTLSGTEKGVAADQWWLRIMFCLCMGILAVGGSIGNMFVICSILMVKELRRTGNIFVLNLGISDLLVNSVSMPFNVLGALQPDSFWNDRQALCVFISSICVPGCSSSLFSIAAIACERYICICHLHIHQKLFVLPNVVVMVALLWIVAHLIHLPNHVGWGSIHYDSNFFICWLDLRLWSYSFFYATVSVMTPVFFCFYAYFKIYLKIRSTRLSRHMITSSRRKLAAHRKARSAWLQEIMLVKTFFKMSVIFMVSWGPVAFLFCFNKLIDPPRWVNLLAIMMAHGNSSTNSLVYYWMTGHFKATTRSASKRFRKSHLEPYTTKAVSKLGLSGTVSGESFDLSKFKGVLLKPT